MQSEKDFYERRVAEERAASACATDEVARDRHIKLANLYSERLAAITLEPRKRLLFKMAFPIPPA